MERDGHRRVVLGLADQREQHLAGWFLGEETGEGTQVLAGGLDGRAGLRDGQLPARVVDQGVEQDVHLGRPPAVDGLLGDAGPGGDSLDGDAVEAAFDQQVIGGMEHG
jgi:hypothetical protein